MRTLQVHLGGKLVGHLVENRKGARFAYVPEVVESRMGKPLLSLCMPVKKKPFGEEKTRNWFDGLLPEGDRRARICHEFGVAEADWLGLLAQIGWECAGAVQVFPEGVAPIEAAGYEPLRQADLAKRLVQVSAQNFDVAGVPFRMSLGGFQDKLCVAMPCIDEAAPDVAAKGVKMPCGTAPSTHILKPEPSAYPGLAESEAWAMTVAAATARCAKVALLNVEGAPETLVVERYDRQRAADGAIVRLHQEDACQALALPPSRKYASSPVGKGDDPTYRAIADLLLRFNPNPQCELQELLRQLTVNFVLGNWDAHAKNTSLLYREPRAPELAPLYDVVPICDVEPRTTLISMRIAGSLDPESVSRKAILVEAASWGLDAAGAAAQLDACLEDLQEGLKAAAKRYPNAAAKHQQGAMKRLESLM